MKRELVASTDFTNREVDMPDRDQQSRDEASKRTVPATGGEQSRGKSAGDAGNPQDGPDTGSAGASRPRGKTEDPDRTL